MDRVAPDTPFEIALDDPPVCGVSNRLERRIRLQFAAVAVGLGMAIGVVVAIIARAK